MKEARELKALIIKIELKISTLSRFNENHVRFLDELIMERDHLVKLLEGRSR
jgi:hypothetical protein